MSVKDFSRIFAGLFLIVLSGCAGLKDHTPEELRTPQFYVETVELKTTIKNIERMFPLYKLNYILERAKFNASSQKAVVWWEAGGILDVATRTLIDFEQKDLNVPHVTAKIYSVNTFWSKAPKRFINMLHYRIEN